MTRMSKAVDDREYRMVVISLMLSLSYTQTHTHTHTHTHKHKRKRLRWSRGSVLAFGTKVRGFEPDRSRWIFQGEKPISTPSFGGEVKPSVPRSRFTAYKRSLNVTWKSGIFRQNSTAISLPFSPTFGC